MAEDLDQFIQAHKRKLAQEKSQINTQNMARDRRPPTPEEKGLPLGSYEERTRDLQQQRKKEYNQFLQQSQNKPSNNRGPDTPEESVLPLGLYEDTRKKLMEQRKKEYNDILMKNNTPRRDYHKENIPPKPGTPEVGLIGQMGKYQNKQKKLQEERKKEYNQLLAGQRVRTGGRVDSDADDYLTTLPGLKEHGSAQRRQEERNREYNEYLRKTQAKHAKHEDGRDISPRRRGRNDERGGEDFQGSLPGLRDHPSAEKEKMYSRNKEYQQFLKQKEDRERRRRKNSLSDDDDEYAREIRESGPRKGWSTPTYEEILEKKRQEERNYRRNDDFYGGMRPSRSEGNLNTDEKDINYHQQDDRRFRELDREFESKKVRFRDTQQDPEAEFSDWLTRLRLKYTADDSSSRERSFSEPKRDYEREPDRRGRDRSPDRSRSRDPSMERPSRSRSRNQEPEEYSATLKVGDAARLSADQRKKEEYRRELEQQMEQNKRNKRKEREVDRQVDTQNAMDVGRRPERRQVSPPRQERPPEPRRAPPATGYKEDSFSPRAILYDDLHKRTPGPPALGGGGILERGFEGLYQPNPGIPPSYLQHAGSTLGASGQPTLTPYNSPLDEAYYYYGMRNPLDPSLATGNAGGLPSFPVNGGLGGAGIPPSRDPPPQFNQHQSPPRDTAPSRADRTPGLPFPSEPENKSRREDTKMTYQQELQRQIEEQRMKKQKAKEEQDRYDRKMEEEIRNYNPFGQGGGGAPMKDAQGNVIANRKALQNPDGRATADLRKMHIENEETLVTGRRPPPEPQPSAIAPPVPPLDLGDPGDPNLPNHARGGHGIFGEPKTQEQKSTADKYKEELRRQIEEKKAAQALEKAKIQEEEQREMRRIEEQQQRMKAEYDEEIKRKKEKEEAARRQNEELKQKAEERKREAEHRKKEAEERRQEEKRQREEEERRQRAERELAARANSPPVPALKTKMQDENRTASPPIPALRNKSEPEPSTNRQSPAPSATSRAPSRGQSADVLSQLAKMRAQLQTERKRVEDALDQHESLRSTPVPGSSAKNIDVNDPRVYQLPSAEPKRNVDIFEVARNKEPVSVRRAPSTDQANPKHLKDFQNLKHKSNTDSRQALRQDFPDDPMTGDGLEAQQLALLHAQERSINNLNKNPSPYEKALPGLNPNDLGLLRDPSSTSMAPLKADSEYIAVNGEEDDRLDELINRKRNDSARSRRRLRTDTPQSYNDPMGSVMSLNPEAISRKNDERLKKLKSLGDDISTGDPDDILDNFMAKQRHNRPPSGQTLADDSWLHPGR